LTQKDWYLPLFLLALVTLLFAGCGAGPSQGVGAACSTGEDCGGRTTAACILRWPAGYCTEFDCSLGSCPSGSHCVTGITFPDVQIDAFCLATCQENSDCRQGYRCTEINRPEKVCAP